MHPYINIAIKAARVAGKSLIETMLHLNVASNKKDLHNSDELLLDVKNSLNNLIFSVISKAYPSHNIQSELTKDHKDAEVTWIIDPLNGEVNFLYGVDFFASSISILTGNQVEHSIIYNPVSDQLFIASKGSGAKLNNKRIRVSINNKLASSLVAINSNLLVSASKLNANLIDSKKLPNIDHRIISRDLGSSALQLAYVAAGKLDGYCDDSLDFYQTAAGSLLVKEAGGFVSDFIIASDPLIKAPIIASNPKLYVELVKFI